MTKPVQIPAATAAEESVIGCALFGGAETVDRIQEWCNGFDAVELFYHAKCAATWMAMVRLADEGSEVSIATVLNSLTKEDPSSEWVVWLANVAGKGTSPAGVTYFLEECAEAMRRRKILKIGEEVVTGSVDVGRPIEFTIAQAETKLCSTDDSNKTYFISTAKEAMIRTIEYVEERSRLGDAIGGIKTGLIDLDNATDGLHNGELTVIAARPGQGKTAIAGNIVEQAAIVDGKKVLFVSLEMRDREITERILCAMARVDSFDLRRGRLTESEQKRLMANSGLIGKAPIHFVNSDYMRISQVRRVCRRFKRANGCDLIVLDYLQKVLPDSHNEKRTYEVGQVSTGLKAMAKELDIPVLALAQINRESEREKGRTPRLADLADSSQIEKDADCVGLLHRKKEQEESRNVYDYELVIAKQRHGPICSIPLVFFGSYTKFENGSRIEI